MEEVRLGTLDPGRVATRSGFPSGVWITGLLGHHVAVGFRRRVLLGVARDAWTEGRAATERRVVTLVAGPNRKSSQEPTKSDQEPRGSLGSQNPYAVNIT